MYKKGEYKDFMKNFFISIILPVYNVEKYVEKCITSILNQSYKNFELIIVNDGSTDRSLEICQKYQGENILLLDKPHGGLSSARNLGLQYCKGEFIAFIDSDDWVEENYLEELINGFTEEDIDITQCGHVRRKDNQKILRQRNVEEKIMDTQDLIWHEHLVTGNLNTMVWGKIFRKSLIENFRFQENHDYEDGMFIIDILEHTRKVKTINKLLYNYRKNPASITQSGMTAQKIYDCFYAAEYVLDKVRNYKPSYTIYARYAFCSKCIRLYYILWLKKDPARKCLQDEVLDKFYENYGALNIRDLKCKNLHKAKLYLFAHHRKITLWLLKIFNL